MYDLYKPIQNTSLDSSPRVKDIEFKLLLEKIYKCYKEMIKKEKSLPNDENEITKILVVDYMKSPKYKQKECDITGVRFEREVTEDHSVVKNGRPVTGRVDIKILPTKGVDHDNDHAYYIIECKRLDSKNLTGTTGLNAHYIKDGIVRFIEKQYNLPYQVNAMLAFVVEKIDIDANIKNINSLANVYFKSESKMLKELVELRPNEIYESEHQVDDGVDIKLYHLMLDISQNME